jgi:hypothetical protein
MTELSQEIVITETLQTTTETIIETTTTEVTHVISIENDVQYYQQMGEVDISFNRFQLYIDQLYELLQSLITVGTPIISTIPHIVACLMVAIEKLEGLVGVDKKNLLCVIIRIFIDRDVSDEEKSQLTLFVDTILPDMIDTIVSVDRQDIAIAVKTIETIQGCCFIVSMLSKLMRKRK